MHGKRNGCEVCPFLMWQWCPWQTFGWFLFSICNRTPLAPRHLRPQHLVSHPQDVFNRFSKKDSEWTGRKKTGLDRRDGGPRTVLDIRWSQQNTRTKDCLSESCSSSKTMASTESSSPRKVSRMPCNWRNPRNSNPKSPSDCYIFCGITNKRKLIFQFFLSKIWGSRFLPLTEYHSAIVTSISMTWAKGWSTTSSGLKGDPQTLPSWKFRISPSISHGKWCGPKRRHSEHPNRTSPTFIQRSHPLIYSNIPDSTKLFMIFPSRRAKIRTILLDIYLLILVRSLTYMSTLQQIVEFIT